MVLVAIDLDDQAAFGPEEVDEEGTEPHVYSRCRDAMAAAQAQELPLEYAARWCLVNHVADAVAARPGAVDDGLPLLARQDPLQVAESPGRGCDRHAAAMSDVAATQRLRAMNRDSAIRPGSPGVRDGDVDGTRAASDELPQLRGAQMAEHCVRPTRLHCREPVALAAQRNVPDCIYAMVEAVKPAGPGAAVDARMRQAARQQLRGCEYAMVAHGQPSDPGFRAVHGRLLSHCESKSPFARNLAPQSVIRRRRRAVE